QDEERAQGRPKDDAKDPDVRTLAQCAATPWYAAGRNQPASVALMSSSASLLNGDPLIAMRAHDERVERRRRKHEEIAREAGLPPMGSPGSPRKKHHRHRSKHKRKRQKKIESPPAA
ncbi:hypothetical protein IWQ57_002740, partial [Coemansia nantahalensis]